MLFLFVHFISFYHLDRFDFDISIDEIEKNACATFRYECWSTFLGAVSGERNPNVQSFTAHQQNCADTTKSIDI